MAEAFGKILGLTNVRFGIRKSICKRYEKLSTAMALSMAQVARANPVAFREVYTILGQKPAEKVTANVNFTKDNEEILDELLGKNDKT